MLWNLRLQKQRSKFCKQIGEQTREDYVVLYFLLKEKFSFDEISQRAIEIFGDLFSDKLFRTQLSYFEDVDYSEEVDYIIANPPSDNEIKQYLIEVSTTIE